MPRPGSPGLPSHMMDELQLAPTLPLSPCVVLSPCLRRTGSGGSLWVPPPSGEGENIGTEGRATPLRGSSPSQEGLLLTAPQEDEAAVPMFALRELSREAP